MGTDGTEDNVDETGVAAVETIPMKAETAKADPLVAKILEWEKTKHKAMTLFGKMDDLADEIIPQLKKRKRQKISDGRFARVKDNFARKNKAFKQAGIPRFEIEILAAD